MSQLNPVSINNTAEDNLNALGISLPTATTPPAAKYIPFSISGNQLVISGQLPLKDGAIAIAGKLGDNVSMEQGQEAAKICAINVLSQAKAACNGDLSKVTQVLKLEILVSCTPEFTEPHIVANGASELILQAFGEEIGKHARVAYGVSVLPMDAAVEVAALIEIS